MDSWKTVRGSSNTVPPEFDTTSSAVYVYQRKNIHQVSTTDEITGETIKEWEYEERKLTHEEYAMIRPEVQQNQIDQVRADIDYVMAMSDIDA